ncbi:GrdX family protein [Brachyspira aalborgi]|uniref:Glycine reductase n=1 Tax=Brachyspira aalborgi TaxID=29522 RepID=A0A5C8ELI1_9SPIR|nr:GrdX family protein [Brachyspira aalborgi]TXJ37834.1 glycine reductase [Brachyspira aalborgi]
MLNKKKNIIITNNPKILEEISNKNIEISYFEQADFMDILYKTRDFIHLGYKLLTHPIVSSIKPYETPYKTIVLACNNGEIDLESIELIENSIELLKNFLDKPRRKLTKNIDEDFKLIDYKLISEAIESIA